MPAIPAISSADSNQFFRGRTDRCGLCLFYRSSKAVSFPCRHFSGLPFRGGNPAWFAKGMERLYHNKRYSLSISFPKPDHDTKLTQSSAFHEGSQRIDASIRRQHYPAITGQRRSSVILCRLSQILENGIHLLFPQGEDCNTKINRYHDQSGYVELVDLPVLRHSRCKGRPEQTSRIRKTMDYHQDPEITASIVYRCVIHPDCAG